MVVDSSQVAFLASSRDDLVDSIQTLYAYALGRPVSYEELKVAGEALPKRVAAFEQAFTPSLDKLSEVAPVLSCMECSAVSAHELLARIGRWTVEVMSSLMQQSTEPWHATLSFPRGEIAVEAISFSIDPASPDFQKLLSRLNHTRWRTEWELILAHLDREAQFLKEVLSNQISEGSFGGEINKPKDESADALGRNDGDGNDRAWSPSELAKELGVTTSTLNKYGKAADVPTPRQGGKDHRYTPEHRKKILQHLAKGKDCEANVAKTAKALLPNSLEIDSIISK